MKMISEETKKLWKDMADLTKPYCLEKCKIPRSCCSKENCWITMEYAREEFQIELKETENKEIPLLGKDGCTAEPYLRPFCTLHVCCISGLGFDPNDAEWTNRYFRLREEIDLKMLEEMQE